MDISRSLQLGERVDEISLIAATKREHHDRLTGFGNHHKLIADLTKALERGSPPSVLAVYELVGWSDYRRVFGQTAGDEMIARLAEKFARVVQPTGVCYRPRQSEFCVLASGRIDDMMFFEAERALKAEGEVSLITAWFGVAFLPDEAADATGALMLADERLGLRTQGHALRDGARTPAPHDQVGTDATGGKDPARMGASIPPLTQPAVQPRADEVSVRLVGSTTWHLLPGYDRARAAKIRILADDSWISLGNDRWCKLTAVAEIKVEAVAS